MHIYEYLFTAIIIISILLASSTIVGTVSEPTLNVSEKEELKVAAQKIMTQILLDPGDPPDWGSNITIGPSNLKGFGLAKYGETTREAYVLDPDKVLRLNKTSPSYIIPPSCVLNLLNLGSDYGLALEFFPPLIVGVTSLGGNDTYEVSVRSEYGELPIVNAEVTARMYYVNPVDNEIADRTTNRTRTTYNGNCTIDFENPYSEMKVLVIVVDYYGVRVVKTYVPDSSKVTLAYMLGTVPAHLFLTNASIIPTSEACEIIVTKKGGEYSIENVTFALDPASLTLTYVEPSTVATLAMSEDNTTLIFASRDTTLTYSSISGSWTFPFAYSLERTVIIGDSTYIVRLYLWRMSW